MERPSVSVRSADSCGGAQRQRCRRQQQCQSEEQLFDECAHGPSRFPTEGVGRQRPELEPRFQEGDIRSSSGRRVASRSSRRACCMRSGGSAPARLGRRGRAAPDLYPRVRSRSAEEWRRATLVDRGYVVVAGDTHPLVRCPSRLTTGAERHELSMPRISVFFGITISMY